MASFGICVELAYRVTLGVYNFWRLFVFVDLELLDLFGQTAHAPSMHLTIFDSLPKAVTNKLYCALSDIIFNSDDSLLRLKVTTNAVCLSLKYSINLSFSVA